jgi:hypothetical protein
MGLARFPPDTMEMVRKYLRAAISHQFSAVSTPVSRQINQYAGLSTGSRGEWAELKAES